MCNLIAAVVNSNLYTKSLNILTKIRSGILHCNALPGF